MVDFVGVVCSLCAGRRKDCLFGNVFTLQTGLNVKNPTKHVQRKIHTPAPKDLVRSVWFINKQELWENEIQDATFEQVQYAVQNGHSIYVI